MDIKKFNNFINEAKILSPDDIQRLMLPFTDMDLDYYLTEEEIVTKSDFLGKFLGRKYRTIVIYTKKLNPVDTYFQDDRIWEFLDEILSLKDRLQTEMVLISTRTDNYTLKYVTNSDPASDLVLKLMSLDKAIKYKLTYSTTDFANAFSSKFYEDKLIIEFDFFTLRKWNRLTKPNLILLLLRKWNRLINSLSNSMDINDFNVDIDEEYKKPNASIWDQDRVTITITVK